MWYVRSEGQWKLMFTFMQNALDDAWEKAAGNYDEFRTGRTFSASTFRLMETPIVKDTFFFES